MFQSATDLGQPLSLRRDDTADVVVLQHHAAGHEAGAGKRLEGRSPSVVPAKVRQRHRRRLDKLCITEYSLV
jgi:hypothetical protein